MRSNNTNKFNPQEHFMMILKNVRRSNNTNKFNPQEPAWAEEISELVQIIQINSILKNCTTTSFTAFIVQIIQINSILKNMDS